MKLRSKDDLKNELKEMFKGACHETGANTVGCKTYHDVLVFKHSCIDEIFEKYAEDKEFDIHDIIKDESAVGLLFVPLGTKEEHLDETTGIVCTSIDDKYFDEHVKIDARTQEIIRQILSNDEMKRTIGLGWQLQELFTLIFDCVGYVQNEDKVIEEVEESLSD